MEFILASNNPKKLSELRAILSEMGHGVISQSEAGLDFVVDETGETFRENAALKAKAVFEATGKAAIADDSGLCVDALDGAPGVHSAYYGGTLCKNDEERYLYLLQQMEGKNERSAHFISTIYAILPDGRELVAEGRLDGEILQKAQGSAGFGYDPVFYVSALGKSLAELDASEKNKISHRAIALEKFKEIWEREHANQQ